MGFCIKCGKQLDEAAAFCNACGTVTNGNAAVDSQPVAQTTDVPLQNNSRIIFHFKKNPFLYWNVSADLEIQLNNGHTFIVKENKDFEYIAVPGNYFMIFTAKTIVGIKCGIVSQSLNIGANETYRITYKPPIWFSGRLKIEKIN